MSVSVDWWRSGVLYQVYPRSFFDPDGDGQGDLAGIAARLPYLKWLGVTGVWLSSISDSANRDWGYDIIDFHRPHPDFGTLEDVRSLTRTGSEAGIAFLHDLISEATSDLHPWFQDALAGIDAPHRDHYVWADPAADGGPPNNWISMFGGPAWTLDEASGQYYLHNFLPTMPDLNWWNPQVRDEFEKIIAHWAELGMRGFRIDTCQGLIKDRLLRDNPPATDEDRHNVRLRGQRPVYNMNRPEVHEVLRSWRALADRLDPAPVLVGETSTPDLKTLGSYYGEAAEGPGSELQMAFNFHFMDQPYEAVALREVIAETEAALPPHAQPVWGLSNHDGSRYVTRWCEGDQDRVRGALLLALCLRGTAVLYYGDELGLPDAAGVPPGETRDCLADEGTLPGKKSRDPARAPMPWEPGANSGFTPAGARPWLPTYTEEGRSVAEQTRARDSHLHFTRDLIRLRGEMTELREESIELPMLAEGALSLGRGRILCHLNLSDRPTNLPGGDVLLSTDRALEGKFVDELELAPWQGAIIG